MLVCFHRIQLLLFGFLTDWFDMSSPMRPPGSQRPTRSLKSLESWSQGLRKDGETRSSSSPDLREPRKSERASESSPEASLLVHHFRHLALQEETCWSSPTVLCSISSLSLYSNNYLQHGTNLGPKTSHSAGWRINKKGETWGHSHGNVCAMEVMEYQLTCFKSWKMMLWKWCTQNARKFGKLSSGHRTGKGQFSFQFQRKTMQMNAQTTAQLHSSHMLVK